jgi:DNA invertase Pin-like site-specific DNA recombinase
MDGTRNGTRADGSGKVGARHLERLAYVYVRQSSMYQVQHHQGSQRRQYERADWAVLQGWPPERVVVLDDDQGVTGALPNARPGFARLVAAVARGEVGIVVSLEGARLARNGPDWAQLLFLCRWSDTLIADEHGVYELSNEADRMVLGIRGEISQIELDTSIRRMVEGRWTMARRGAVMTIPPAGYDVDDLHQFVRTRDEAVAQAIRTVFEKFDELGSARQVWVWWRDQGLSFPVRRMDLRSHPVEWRPPRYAALLNTLRHPLYAGAYAFGRSETVRRLDPDDAGAQRRIRRDGALVGASSIVSGSSALVSRTSAASPSPSVSGARRARTSRSAYSSVSSSWTCTYGTKRRSGSAARSAATICSARRGPACSPGGVQPGVSFGIAYRSSIVVTRSAGSRSRFSRLSSCVCQGCQLRPPPHPPPPRSTLLG